MRRCLYAALLTLCAASAATAADKPKVALTGLTNPESVCYGPGGHLYVTEIGEFDKAGDGKVTVIKDGKAEPFATGLNDPKGIVFLTDAFYVTDKDQVIKVDAQGKTSVFAAADAFPNKPKFLNDIAVEPATNLLVVSDSGDLMGKDGHVYRIDVATGKIDTLVDNSTLPELQTPNGLVFDGIDHVLMLDFKSGFLYRVALADRSATKISEGFEGGDGIIWDKFGRLFITSWSAGKVFGIPRAGEAPVLMIEGLKSAADCCLAADGRTLIVPDMLSGEMLEVSTTIAGWEVDESPAPAEVVPAFPNLKFTGWDDGSETGVVVPLRPIVLTHAGDDSGLIYIATQQGVIHKLKNDDKATTTEIFLDITDRVRYLENQNEEGLLGLAFHPDFKRNGELFIFYTDVHAEMANVLSRFRLSKDNPGVVDPKSEEELIRFEKPFWNHDGGTITFGPDGYLYITHGDGGAGGDPHKNGQNLGTLLGKVLRIDVNKKANGKNYAIPADNPFVKQKGALPEIWAYGLRNIWRMAFDQKTGQLWAGEVGQNLFEEIILLESGGNYGWSLRESFHPFGPDGVGVRKDLIEPIWEYHHDIGKSVTGGLVYRGKAIPALDGSYLYADYVSNLVWALRYDPKQQRVVANQPVKSPKLSVMSFGEDAEGNAYLLSASPEGRGIHRVVKRSGK